MQLSHEIEEASLDLLIEIGMIEKDIILKNADREYVSSDPRFMAGSKESISAIDGYISKLNNLKNQRLLNEQSIKTNKYSEFVSLSFQEFAKATEAVNRIRNRMTDRSRKFNLFLVIVVNLHPSLFKMNEMARYPLTAFECRNIDYINNKSACNNIIRMTEALINIYKQIMKDPIAL